MKKAYKVIIVLVVIGLVIWIAKPIIEQSNELKQLKKERQELIDSFDSLQVEKLRKDSLITKLVKDQNRKVDSVKSDYSLKLNILKDEYKGKIDNISELSIDDNIRLFTELISEKDSI